MAADASLPRICVLGSLNMDLVSYVPHHPAPGETLTSNSFAVSPGGKGANQAVACAKLSRSRPSAGGSTGAGDRDTGATAHVSMVGAVGADTYGQELLDSLGAHGVDVGGVAAAGPLKTGVAVIIVDEPTGQNRIVLSPEANHQGMAPGDFAAATWPRVMSMSMSMSVSVAGAGRGQGQGQGEGTPPDLLVMQLEVPLQTVLLALAAARRDGVPVLLNPAPAVALPAEAYRGLAHLVVNETEAAALSGLPVARLDTEDGCAEAAAVFARRGVEVVIITLGGRGVYYMATGSGPAAAAAAAAKKEEKEEEVVVVKGLVPAEEVAEVVDTTAAGDTFVGQYALEVVRSRGGEFDVEAAVRKSNRAAALTVQRKGAAASIPWRDEVV
ncbi:hypothetical protein VSDG_00004 [Cytospora chrysosperma]|uniref:Ribokinase n=1 Tax=Cytospora chrysosperma TaxID=252740 RepID=A0A423WNT5_CYTCH|nr:hypothetical protein VSDG_00004 [Valsa sordida]